MLTQDPVTATGEHGGPRGAYSGSEPTRYGEHSNHLRHQDCSYNPQGSSQSRENICRAGCQLWISCIIRLLPLTSMLL